MAHFNTDVGFFFLVNKREESDRIQLAYEVAAPFSLEMQVTGWKRKFKRNQSVFEWSKSLYSSPSSQGGGDQ